MTTTFRGVATMSIEVSTKVSFDTGPVYTLIAKRAERVVKKAGYIAFASARERAPIRKIFNGGRRTTPRFMSLGEAKTALPGFLATEPRWRSGRQGRMGRPMSDSEALTYLQKVPVATGRNKANIFTRTALSTPQFRVPQARDANGNERRDEHGNNLFAAMRDLEYAKGRDGKMEGHLYDRSAEYQLTARGRYEVKTARAVSIPLGSRAKLVSKHGSYAERESFKQGLDLQLTPTEGQIGGSLRRSIEPHNRSTGDRISVSVVAGGESAPYARFVEFGTRHAAAQPFLRPALKYVEGPYKTMMREVFPGSK